MLQTSARLLRLLTTLQGRRSWSGPELAERLEITARTLRRDIDRLRSLGYPVHSTAGVAGGYSLGAGAQLPPLMLDDDEGVAIAVALQTAAVGGVAHIDDAAQRALAKLDQLLPARARKRLKAVRSSILRVGQTGPLVELEAVSVLAAACSEQVSVAFDYKDQQGRPTRRDVDPHRVVHMERRWYLVAWDQLRNDWRTFRIDRLSLPIERKKPFVARNVPDDDVATYVRRSISVAPYTHRVRVRFGVPFDEARTRIGMRHGVLSPLDDHSCRFETGADSLEHVATWIAMLGIDFSVEEPNQLSEAMVTLAARLTRASGR